MTIIKEYVKLFAIIGVDSEKLSYRSNEDDAKKCVDGYAQIGISATCRELAIKTFIIRTDTYQHSLDYFDTLFQEAKKDFPFLNRRNAEVVHFSGSRYRRTFGIKFSSSANAPTGFNLIDETEETF